MRRVFISYSHDNEQHAGLVSDLADSLRKRGVPVILDRDMLPAGPPEGWPAWSEAKVKEADLVLVACTERYCARYELKEEAGVGLGAVCEARAIRQLLYNSGGMNEKFRVILFNDGDNSHIPVQLQGYHRFSLHKQDVFDQLLAWLTGPADASTSEVSVPEVKAEIAWPPPLPDHRWDLADRREIFALFEKMLTGQSVKRILLLEGVSNRGKTVTLSELFGHARLLRIACSFLDFKGCPSFDDLFEAMRLDLGPQVLRSSYKGSGSARFFQLISDFQALTAPLLLVFDTYEQASPDAQRWLESQLLPRLDRCPGVLAVIAGQQIPKQAKQSWARLAETVELQPIRTTSDWLEYIHRKWDCSKVRPEYVEGLMLATAGNPGNLSALIESMVRGLQAGD